MPGTVPRMPRGPFEPQHFQSPAHRSFRLNLPPTHATHLGGVTPVRAEVAGGLVKMALGSGPRF